MANPFGGTEYEITLRDPSDGEEWAVTLRELNAADEAAIDDQLSFALGGEGEDGEEERVDAQMPMGSMRLITVTRAVVRWSLPQTATVHTIRALRKDLFHQIYSQVRFAGDAMKDPTPAPSSATEPPTSSPEPPSVEEEPKLSAAAPAADANES